MIFRQMVYLEGGGRGFYFVWMIVVGSIVTVRNGAHFGVTLTVLLGDNRRGQAWLQCIHCPCGHGVDGFGF
ncbi:MAG: hypothetical protein M2R45_02400 [Verrucomicrobia subdivision 3 bacterium]|nr:hypothetical protein [Limisphaerales bacterium]MCS1416394.1 hypothetical protein [Limisphaerales bacterium]